MQAPALAGTVPSRGISGPGWTVIPRNTDEALKQLQALLSPQVTEAIRAGNTSPDWWARSIGTDLLNEWVSPPHSPLTAYFRSIGIDHPQDIPGLIKQFYYLYLNHRLQPRDVRVAIQLRQQYWGGLLTSKQLAAYARNAQRVDDNFDGDAFSARVAALVMRQRALRERWILQQASVRNLLNASTYQEIIARLDPALDITTLNLNTDTTLISMSRGDGIGQVLIASGAPGRPPVLWRMDMHVPQSGPYASDLRCWRATARIDPCNLRHMGLLPSDAKGHPRFYVQAWYTHVAGATFKGQLSLWLWNGHSAVPIYVTSYAVEADHEMFKAAGDTLSFESKGDYETLSPCGSCGARETLWSTTLSKANEVKILPPTSLTPELDLVDELYTRVRNHQAADDLASPAALAVIQRSWNDPARNGAAELFFNDQEEVTRNGGKDQLCLLAYYGGAAEMPAILFTFSGSGSALRVVSARENTDPQNRSCTGAK